MGATVSGSVAKDIAELVELKSARRCVAERCMPKDAHSLASLARELPLVVI